MQNPKHEIRNSKQTRITKTNYSLWNGHFLNSFEHLRIGILDLFRISIFDFGFIIFIVTLSGLIENRVLWARILYLGG